MLSEWRMVDGQTFLAMLMSCAELSYFTINGEAFPATETINAQRCKGLKSCKRNGSVTFLCDQGVIANST
jgi:hypothetical protein